MTVSKEKRHLVYAWLIYRGLNLSEADAHLAGKHWYGIDDPPNSAAWKNYESWTPADWEGKNPTGISRTYASINYSKVYFKGVRSVPDWLLKALICDELVRLADPAGIAGFYKENERWRLNINHKKGLLLPYKNDTRFIQGLRIYKNVHDQEPVLLTSRGLPEGAKAIPCRHA